MADLADRLRRLVAAQADSLQFRPDQPPLLYLRGEPRPLREPPLDAAAVAALFATIADSTQRAALAAHGQADGIHVDAGLGRFRFRARRLPEGVALALRPIEPTGAPRPVTAPHRVATGPHRAGPSAGPSAASSAGPSAASSAGPSAGPAPLYGEPISSAAPPAAAVVDDDPAWLRRLRTADSIPALLAAVFAVRAADLVLSVGRPPRVRMVGEHRAVEGLTVDEPALFAALGDTLTAARRAHLAATGSVDLALELPGAERRRFRVNVFRTLSGLAAAFRPIWDQVPTLADLELPAALAGFVERPHGLVLFAGPTGAGKSTTLCALVDQINRTRRRHVITLEDPIEYIFRDQRSVIHQREVGVHVESFAAGLRAALREAPDVILVGEMRDHETIGAALTAAETGHLVLSTIHSGSVQQAIDRMIDVFPEHQQQQVRTQLADVLEAVVVQRLLTTADGTRRVPALEVVRVTYAIGAMIRERRTHQFTNAIQSGRAEGMVGFDTSLAELVERGLLDAETALRHARDPNLLRRTLGEPEPLQPA